MDAYLNALRSLGVELHAPASPETLGAMERTVGFLLRDHLRTLYQDHGGSRELVSAVRRADAARVWWTDVVGMPAEMVAPMENPPMWPGLQALAHTLPYDLALSGDQGIPVENGL